MAIKFNSRKDLPQFIDDVLNEIENHPDHASAIISDAIKVAHREGREEGVEVGRSITAAHGRPIFE